MFAALLTDQLAVSTARPEIQGNGALVGRHELRSNGTVLAAPVATAASVVVTALPDLDDLPVDAHPRAVLHVAYRLAPYSALEQVRNLAAASGWPVIGVLEQHGPSQRRNRT
jgi:hypothetical protein